MQYIVLLRGINVGGRILKMDELISCFEKNGYKDVITILQTGNVIINTTKKDTGKLTNEIESMLSKTFDYPAKVIVITPDQLKSMLDKIPFKKDENFHRYLVFTKDSFEKELVKNAPDLDPVEEKIMEGAGVVYWTVRKGSTLDSSFGKYLAKTTSKHFSTSRNANTLEKMFAKTETKK
ncbi:MAG: DUF1697 domain-containing protein [Ginsengibacter sp.]